MMHASRFEGLLRRRIFTSCWNKFAAKCNSCTTALSSEFLTNERGNIGSVLISCGIQNDSIFLPNWPKHNKNIYKIFSQPNHDCKTTSKTVIGQHCGLKKKKKTRNFFSLSLVSLKSQFQCVYILYINKPVFGHGCLCVHSSVGVCPQCVYISHSLRKWKKHFLSARK